MSSTPKDSKRTTKEKAAAARAAAEAEQRRRDRRIRLIGGTAIVVAVAVIIGFGYWGSKQNSPSTPGTVADAKVPTGVNAGDGSYPWAVPYNKVSGKPTLAIWEDFQCPSCAEFEKAYGAAVVKLADDGKVNLVWRPTTFLDDRFAATSPNPYSSHKAAMAWGCAIDAGKTKQFHSTVFANQPSTEGQGYSDAQITQFAQTAGITGAALTTFQSCVAAKTYDQWVSNSYQAFVDAGVPGTPTAYLNGTEVPAATLQDMTQLEKLIASTPAS
ncbi:MAG TPA: thioredoxin domain-containing protein [Candidatus Angelobacter sp.]|nr:thioredoxin domain-containing protein [Candidatus Angelobacter sp.]